MNILYLCDEYPPGRHGGIGSVVQVQAREMAKRGHKVVVAGFYDWGYGGADEFYDGEVKVYRFRRGLDSKWFAKKDSKRVRATYKLLKLSGIFQIDIGSSLKRYKVFLEDLIHQHKIDIVERPDFNEYMQYCTKYTPFPKLSIPTLVKLHGTISYILKGSNSEPSALLYRMEQDSLSKADLVCSVSKYIADTTAGLFGYTKRIEVIPNGVKTDIKQDVQKIPDQVVFTGSLVENKGIYQLMKAWNSVIEKNEHAHLWVLGKGHIAKAEMLLSNKARRAVTFMGHVSLEVLLKYVNMATVAVFPSYAETFGLAAAEAMACGTATIFTKRAAGPEIIRDGIDGILIDPDNVDEIAEKVILLLNNDELRHALEVNGRQRIEKEFEIGKIIDRHVDLYERLLHQCGRFPAQNSNAKGIIARRTHNG